MCQGSFKKFMEVSSRIFLKIFIGTCMLIFDRTPLNLYFLLQQILIVPDELPSTKLLLWNLRVLGVFPPTALNNHRLEYTRVPVSRTWFPERHKSSSLHLCSDLPRPRPYSHNYTNITDNVFTFRSFIKISFLLYQANCSTQTHLYVRTVLILNFYLNLDIIDHVYGTT